ncbi:wingless-type MMTV integration site family, member 1 precursor [Saccoglossus kowalevskii]|uniref:Protein Wnt n=1 Tax=Saccoglossus kowalevskii TaxID=10224 RepID=B5M215_SACKO|nr:wingless-type MMTV integration site family, member 1 precursor [Saccoglossus kowalevskii]ACH68427.1 wingless-type MMTV integration site family member 1 protein [Saccoglossus kowalevskii]
MKFCYLIIICLYPTLSLGTGKAQGTTTGKWWGVASSQQKSNLVVNRAGVPVVVDQTPLNKKQRKLIRLHPGSLSAITNSVGMSKTECKWQFKERRWNCPTNKNDRGGRNLFGNILESGCRETAFIYAITASAVAHSVARSCSEGSIETCNCDYEKRGKGGKGWEWGGCSDNADFGSNFSRKFVDAGEKGRDLRYYMNKHNNAAGRRIVTDNMRRECKCHGMSGSCQVKTCWMRLPTFREVGDILKERFDGASQIAQTNNGHNRGTRRKKRIKHFESADPQHKHPTASDLVYFEESPDFCELNKKVGSLGTRGRQCNNTSIGIDGCDLLCCERGYRSEIEQVTERCSCTFHWCCQVKCETCVTQRTVHTCL